MTPEEKEAAIKRLGPMTELMVFAKRRELAILELSTEVAKGGFDVEDMYHRLADQNALTHNVLWMLFREQAPGSDSLNDCERGFAFNTWRESMELQRRRKLRLEKEESRGNPFPMR